MTDTTVKCEYCGTSYVDYVRNVTVIPRALKCTQCGAPVKVYRPLVQSDFVTSGSCLVFTDIK